ncbi:glucose-6-phosphate isomerase [Leptospira interrogans]|uniref:glucose-6-phosphate isomerase n=1 Tax=Leptospira interrogans TaxID=173 RepID=UPI0002B98240|nr:glucose-6-phosphate isomerase [Leptospira interrogans]AKH75986.1 glucose-6-phosphate isomerase [Leptospira interrogans serovar Bratislava]EMN09504.1 glucose-6-phosphate isomerase [Leptospira interrogans serovar Muenchen str. Brem 129]KLO77212.1 Glucose-6-phosphate isomerase [Leptospira interrogans serovar Muenchen]KWV22840.1 glucose-6-phosphate isomerase [Leptospira interrogans]KWV24393.1 glucose-6-phosphate isomerase [Leptospira interrogans]
MIRLETRFASSFIQSSKLEPFLEKSESARLTLHSSQGQGKEYLGWLYLPKELKNSEIERMTQVAERLRNSSEVIVVIGIGGSYLGSRAVLEATLPFFKKPSIGNPEIIFAGHHLESRYFSELIEYLEDKNFSINVISKSGTTTEPAIAFRLLWELLRKKYGSSASSRVVATTDSSKGVLKKFADSEKLDTFTIPDNVGGRYSVLTPVGLFPLAVAGISISKFILGFQNILNDIHLITDPTRNPATYYSALRNYFLSEGRYIEVLANFNPSLRYVSEWWKQLFGESEGKENKGIFPASMDFTTDLHSLGQYIQEGKRILFETVLSPSEVCSNLTLKPTQDNLDSLNFLSGNTLGYVNEQARLGTLLAHADGGVPCLELVFPDISPQSLGELMYFFEYSCAISGYSLGVNPFDQPGVEAYKKNMFALLNKPGFEQEGETLRKRISRN